MIEKLRALRLTQAELVETARSRRSTGGDRGDAHLLRISTNNPLERILREIRRRTRVVGALPILQWALPRLGRLAGWCPNATKTRTFVVASKLEHLGC